MSQFKLDQDPRGEEPKDAKEDDKDNARHQAYHSQ